MSRTMSEENVVETALEAGRTLQRLATHGDLASLGPFLVLPNGTVQTLEHLANAPQRVRAQVDVRDADSFLGYVHDFSQGRSLVCADESTLTFTAILDYHAPDHPSWCEHRVVLTLRPTPSWTRWQQQNKRKMPQQEFSEFLEDSLPDIAAPPGAQLLEIANQFEAKKQVTFSSAIRLQNGERQFTYEESIAGTSKKGTVTMPETFELGLEPFEHAGKYQLTARWRYRIENGHLVLWYDLLRSEDVVRTAFAAIREAIQTSLGEPTMVLSGPAPKVK